MGKQDGLAVRVNSCTPDILAFTETWIINNPIILNSTSYEEGEGGIGLEGGLGLCKGTSKPIWTSVRTK